MHGVRRAAVLQLTTKHSGVVDSIYQINRLEHFVSSVLSEVMMSLLAPTCDKVVRLEPCPVEWHLPPLVTGHQDGQGGGQVRCVVQ